MVGIKGIPLIAETSHHITMFTAIHPIMNISLIISIYLTILLTLERFNTIVITGMAMRETSQKKIKLSMLAIILVFVTYNIPKFFEYTLKSTKVRSDYDLQNKKWVKLVNQMPEQFEIEMNDLEFLSTSGYHIMMETGGAHECE